MRLFIIFFILITSAHCSRNCSSIYPPQGSLYHEIVIGTSSIKRYEWIGKPIPHNLPLDTDKAIEVVCELYGHNIFRFKLLQHFPELSCPASVAKSVDWGNNIEDFVIAAAKSMSKEYEVKPFILVSSDKTGCNIAFMIAHQYKLEAELYNGEWKNMNRITLSFNQILSQTVALEGLLTASDFFDYLKDRSILSKDSILPKYKENQPAFPVPLAGDHMELRVLLAYYCFFHNLKLSYNYNSLAFIPDNNKSANTEVIR
ncbi:MAG: hypothetical protein HQL32_02670 [Planctomycetes bacterium]|nr:hypothetical protein [Planctomycetota bacterium]